jgi:hypothetical protein
MKQLLCAKATPSTRTFPARNSVAAVSDCAFLRAMEPGQSRRWPRFSELSKLNHRRIFLPPHVLASRQGDAHFLPLMQNHPRLAGPGFKSVDMAAQEVLQSLIEENPKVGGSNPPPATNPVG